MMLLKKQLWLGGLILVLLLTGCNLPSPGPAATATQTGGEATPIFKNTPIFGNTPLFPATATPSATSSTTDDGPQPTSDGTTTPGLPQPPRGTQTGTPDGQPTNTLDIPGPQETEEGTRAAPTPDRTRSSSPTTPTAQPTPGGKGAPSNTQPTRVVAGQPSDRPGAMLFATYLSQPPTIDGSLDEWAITGNMATRIAYQTNDWPGQENLAFNYRIGWDEQHLYLAFDVTDAHFVQEAFGDQIFKGDGVEILFDANFDDDFDVAALNDDDFQLGLTAGSGMPGVGMQNYLWYPQSLTGVSNEIQLAGTTTNLGYTIEAAIPWTLFGVTPTQDQAFGFVVSLHNNDQPGQQLQSIISSAPVRELTDPTTWGSLILDK